MAAEKVKTLTKRQQAFVEHYLANGFNATKAAKDAGYSEKTAYSIGSENLRKPEIASHVRARMKALTMSADEALYRLSAMARGDLGEFLGLSVEELKAHPQRFLLHKVKTTRRIIPDGDGEPIIEERNEIEAYDAQAALNVILKERHLEAGEPTERQDHTGAVTAIRTIEVVRPAPNNG